MCGVLREYTVLQPIVNAILIVAKSLKKAIRLFNRIHVYLICISNIEDILGLLTERIVPFSINCFPSFFILAGECK